jgi:hypothetical protein
MVGALPEPHFAAASIKHVAILKVNAVSRREITGALD